MTGSVFMTLWPAMIGMTALMAATSKTVVRNKLTICKPSARVWAGGGLL